MENAFEAQLLTGADAELDFDPPIESLWTVLLWSAGLGTAAIIGFILLRRLERKRHG